ncbi:putative F-box only protein 39-like [Apostichopus japonicus]|uniref:Putative F-box only protein 39-like n=1 Tax=Stichopus japonicus TaxID=307972 RepID=A0A2G8JT88_STIJA|nr:putative F-box only protein 39-like [Apostichopus japonicus]
MAAKTTSNKKIRTIMGRLPAHIISEIACYLYPWERVRMAKACRRWYNGILRSPSLWRSTEVQLRGNWRDNSEIDYIRYLGQYLKRLTVCGAIRCHRHTKKFQRSVTTIFANLYRQGPVQLNDLTITEFHFQSYFRGSSGAFARAGVIKSINRFLRQQRKLRAIDLSFNTVTEEEGVSLLSSLANARCVTKLERLNIEEFFKNKERMYVSVEFVHAVTQFINLRLLVINYSCCRTNFYAVSVITTTISVKWNGLTFDALALTRVITPFIQVHGRALKIPSRRSKFTSGYTA